MSLDFVSSAGIVKFQDLWANGVFESLLAYLLISRQAGVLCDQLRPRVVERARCVARVNTAAVLGVVNATAVRARFKSRSRRLW